MITDKEQELIQLSPVKADYYQIWNELVETADKLSQRWKVADTNESDPGVVLLKMLTAVADKLNYTVNKNILECFLPTAAQEESVRKICDVLGYSMKYYQSATTNLTISYSYSNTTDTSTEYPVAITIPAYTNFKDNDDSINYHSVDDITLYYDPNSTNVDSASGSILVREGEVITCAEDTNYIVTIEQIDDNNRYYLPELQIAENGIYITNVLDSEVSSRWEKTSNLNLNSLGSKVFKFGFDSRKNCPYIQFPKDIAELIGDGLIIRYTRTLGVNGNISARTLSKIELPSDWESSDTYSVLSEDNFIVSNISSASNGSDKETLNEAYNNYKKTIGTFDTLVTCRDYINAIYNMVDSIDETTPVVSNIIVSDIRDDINKAIKLCSFSDYGIYYKDLSLTKDDENKIDHFDLILYPFKSLTNLNTTTSYSDTFKLDPTAYSTIINDLDSYKTISHVLKLPEDTDIAAIKVYLKLNVSVITTTKINAYEEAEILSAIYKAIYKNFNARKLDFGESIPRDSIISTIKNAHTKIKDIIYNDPKYEIGFLYGNNTEDRSDDASLTDNFKTNYDNLALRNVLAGRVALFDYDETFEPSYTEVAIEGGGIKSGINTLTSNFTIKNLNSISEEYPLTLGENEIVQFRAPNLATELTYSAYVNYYIHLESDSSVEAVPATFQTLATFLSTGSNSNWSSLGEYFATEAFDKITRDDSVTNQTTFESAQALHGALFSITPESKAVSYATTYKSGDGHYYGYIAFSNDNFIYWYKWLTSLALYTGTTETYSGYFRKNSNSIKNQKGYLVDDNFWSYSLITQYDNYYTDPLNSIYVQKPDAGKSLNGLGKSIDLSNAKAIKSGTDYQLRSGEYLAINYTPSTSTDSADTSTTANTSITLSYTEGAIIRPNFDLYDSAVVNASGVSYSKKLDSAYAVGGNSVSNMYTLDANQQIEIRHLNEVMLKADSAGDLVYIYWQRNDENELVNQDTNTIKFSFDEDFDKDGKATAYTLKAGEYVYLTDASKLDLAIYGSGTKIIKGEYAPDLTKTKVTNENLANDILENGLAASIPWVAYSNTYGNNIDDIKYCWKAVEYQYVTLAKDSQLRKLSLGETVNIIDSTKWVNINNVDNVLYALNKADKTSQSLTTLNLNSDGCPWYAKTNLNIVASPTTTQTLRYNSSNTKSDPWESVDSISINSGEYEIEPTSTDKSKSFKANIPCTSTSGKIIASTTLLDAYGVDDLKINVFKEYIPVIGQDTKNILDLNNFGNGKYTKISFKGAVSDKVYTKLNIKLETNQYALIMFYYIGDGDKENAAYITLDNKATACIVNNVEGTDNTWTWWAGYTNTDTEIKKYYFKNDATTKLNIVMIDKSCTLSIYPNAAVETTPDNLIFSNMDVVNVVDATTAIDTDTKLPKLNSALALKNSEIAIYNKLRELDPNHNFYYNALLDNDLIIDLNTISDVTLADQSAWYDYNNINNKFVISEIDASYLKTGITINSASKR